MNALEPSIIEALQESLRQHWTAIATYASQSLHFARWGYSKLAEAARKDADEERGHADRLIERLEAFDMQPDCSLAAEISFPRHDFNGILTANIALETAAANVERAGIQTAREAGDEITAKLLAKNLEGSEESIVAIEAAQKTITQIGLDNYLANQV